MNLFTLVPEASFLDSVAAEWRRRTGGDPVAMAEGLILLPTRRSARALADAFLRVAGGKPLLMPRIVALGAVDEAPLALAGALDLPPAVEPSQRLAALTRMILAMGGAGGAPRTADRAWMLATELATLMDEAERAEIDLGTALPSAADPAFAAHWKATLDFLHIVTAAWPAWLAEQRLMNPAARHVALLDAQAQAWGANPPGHPVLVAGIGGGMPAVARLLRTVAAMPGGEVLLPGLDLGVDDEVWEALEASHPQAGLRALLAAMGAERREVRLWPASVHGVPQGRARTIASALLPAPALSAWTHPAPVALEGLIRLDPADQQEEAAAIAMLMREALERPGERVALVTPDRDLAGRVAVELRRWGIVADDSAGEPLADTPPGVFMRLVATAVVQQLAPVPLLAMLKHPLAAAGLAPGECRAGARALELACLRGPRPGPGLAGLRRALDLSRRERPRRPAARLLERMEACLEPVLRMATAVVASPSELMTALIEGAEYLAATDEQPGPARLWAGEEGEALAARLASVQAVLPMLPDQPPAMLPGLLDAVLEGAVVRSRRALRGGQAAAEHPRVAIWGLLEARLQSPDTIVLGGLAEGVWPPTADPGPWMSRAMREQIGLDSPERIVGQTAHDFAAAVCAAPRVVLSCPRRRDGAPAVPTRWLVRLDAFLAGQQAELAEHPAPGWARVVDQPVDGPRPVSPPRPCPPLTARPRQLSVTEIETWLSDPYAIYARHVLGLPALDPLDQSTDAADYGSIVHAGLHEFLREQGTAWPPNAAERLRVAMELAIRKAGLRPALIAWWSPRVGRIAEWVAAEEMRRRGEKWPAAVASEVRGLIDFDRPGGTFRLVGRADRIEQYADGSLAILDYKTGYAPSQREVETGFAPQLPLEALMAEAGAFGTVEGPVRELIYWHLTGGFLAGEVRSLFKGDVAAIAASVATCRQRLLALIDAYDDQRRCYLSRPHPATAPRFSNYTQLARVAEWEAAGDEE